MNFKMWKKALQVIPNVSKEEWDGLDVISKWLISTRAAVLIMTLLSAIFAGLFAWHDNKSFRISDWVLLALGLIFAHAANNLLNDYTDYIRGVDKGNYFRTMYGPQPIADGLMTKKQHLGYFLFTGLLALICGIILLVDNQMDPIKLVLIGLGAFFVLFYTWPLKYLALGEISVLIVWGPLMIGGGYYILTNSWSWNVVLASLPYVLGVTTVIFGKHIDKIEVDKEKKIYTLPVIIGEKFGRSLLILLMALPYILVMVLIITKFFTPIMLLVIFALPTFIKLLPQLNNPRPESKPEGFPEGQGGWPLFFAPLAFVNNRSFGIWFMLGLILDVVIKSISPLFWT
jgi:1,4-dihydroxy-2-naphthoate polyprenyltransferase